MWAFWIGLAVGAATAIPLAWAWSQRTERRVRALEQRTRSAERLAELGTLTSGLAHEIKNPLSTIGLNVQLLREDLSNLLGEMPNSGSPPLSRLQSRFDSLGRETDRLKAILEDFLRFAGRVNLDLVATDANELIDELCDFFAPQAAEADIQLRTQLNASPSTIAADANLLKQALLNLVINATQAMTAARRGGGPHGGANELMIRTENRREFGENQIAIHVIDTGPGIPVDARGKLFQPYFSTKADGSGLGLPTARRIVEEHGGRLSVVSEPGRGTDFVISLPCSRN
jgi:signal transduction histidine kinase